MKTDWHIKVKELRKENKLTQDEFADLIGSRRNTIASIESQKQLPTLEFLQAVINKFKVPASYFFNDDVDDIDKIMSNKYTIPSISTPEVQEENGNYQNKDHNPGNDHYKGMINRLEKHIDSQSSLIESMEKTIAFLSKQLPK